MGAAPAAGAKLEDAVRARRASTDRLIEAVEIGARVDRVVQSLADARDHDQFAESLDSLLRSRR
jgi:hypothetical protein